MKRVHMVQTSDGELHADTADAIRHAQKRYGEALSRLAHKLVQVDKYTAMQAAIEANLTAFLQLKELQNDCVPPTADDDSDND